MTEKQEHLLQLFREIDEICKENNLRYVMAGGTAIGVVRNEGFIPWDDDMDITMKRQDYIKFARAKGVPAKSILFGHALKNALIPVVTIFGMDLGNMIAFTTITETIFAWPGMGKLLIDAINKSDRPIIVAYLMAAACMFVVLNFIVDILYTLIDPRIELR